jgi:hypothetical protein
MIVLSDEYRSAECHGADCEVVSGQRQLICQPQNLSFLWVKKVDDYEFLSVTCDVTIFIALSCDVIVL